MADEHPRARVRERQRQGAEPGADLDHAVALAHLRRAGDPAREVRVDQEVLTERLRRVQAVVRGEPPDRGRAETALTS